MKFLSFLLAVVFSLSFTITAFAEEASLELEVVEPVSPTEGTSAEVTEESGEATSGNEYLDMVLNNMQNDITDLENEVSTLNEEVALLSETSEGSETTSTETESTTEEETNPDLGIEDGTITGVSVYSVSPITPEDTTGLKSVLLELIGDYDPIIVEFEYENANGYTSYLRDFMPDYVWCASFVMLALIIYCLFRLGGTLIG